MMKNYNSYLLVMLVLAGLIAAVVSGCPKSAEQSGGATDQVTPPPSASQTNNGAAEMPETAAEPETPAEPETTEPADGAESEAGAGQEGGAEAETPAEPEGGGEAETPTSGIDGLTVYKEANCAMCHGGDMAGTTMAPPLSNLSANWDADTLQQYMRDPESYSANDPRLDEQNKQYSMQMPAFDGSEDELAAMVTWLLSGTPME
jgi:hypothetical protein